MALAIFLRKGAGCAAAALVLNCPSSSRPTKGGWGQAPGGSVLPIPERDPGLRAIAPGAELRTVYPRIQNPSRLRALGAARALVEVDRLRPLSFRQGANSET
eukprot:10921968-Alexandrium_andersonii.AAC.1